MEYTIKELANLAGVSTRTLRFYDQIGLLKPKQIGENGYRIYGEKEVEILQHILFYREFEFKLEEIKHLIKSSDLEELRVLEEHLGRLANKKERIDKLIDNISKTIIEKKGGKKMSDKEKFEGFKKELIKENEEKYGKEIREKYGEDAVNQSNAKLHNMTEEQYKEVIRLQEELMDTLRQAYELKDPTSNLAKKVVELHKRWLCFYWTEYSEAAHMGLADMYVADERFRKYYDVIGEGGAEFLRDAIKSYFGK